MRLSDVWFTALSENESGQMITVYGRDELNEFTESGKFKERVEITWKYEEMGEAFLAMTLARKWRPWRKRFVRRWKRKTSWLS